MKNMTLQHIAKAVGGQLNIPEEAGFTTKDVLGVVIDNRKVEPGFLFVPIKGERVDGHSFIADAFKKGAAAVLSEHVLENPAGPYILVKSTPQALKELAAYYRQQLSTKVVGVIGSVGKTSTKEMLASVLSQRFKVQKTQGNFNNEIGLPLTLFSVGEEHEIAVVEMGISDLGEMSSLGLIAHSEVVVFTNIGTCHLENLIDRDGVLKAKTEVLSYMPNGAWVVYNADDDKLSTVCSSEHNLIGYGMNGQAYHATAVQNGFDGVWATLHCKNWESRVHIPLPGEHNVYNALAAMAVGDLLGMNRREIVAGVNQAATISGRNNVIHANEYTVLDDCYNANPASMRAALEVLGLADARRIAVLGDMGELGKDEKALHYQLGKAVIENKIDVLFTAGRLAEEIARGAANEAASECPVQLHSFPTKEEMLPELLNFVKKGDAILVKASHFMGFDEVVKALTS